MKFSGKITNNLHLSIAVLIGGTVFKFSKELLDAIPYSNGLKPNSVYRVPKDDIHFTLVSFLPPKQLGSPPEESDIREYKNANEDLISKVLPKISQLTSRYGIEIRGVYLADKLTTIALRAYAPDELIRFGESLTDVSPNNQGWPRIKKYKDEGGDYFAVSIIRFFKKLNNEESKILSERIKRLDEKLKARPIRLKVSKSNMHLAISDDYLSRASFFMN